MIKTIMLGALGIVAITATPAMARSHAYNGSVTKAEKLKLDYDTDVSEAKRELRSDLARADDQADVQDAWDEYHRELADARHDMNKELAERGLRRGRVTLGYNEYGR